MLCNISTFIWPWPLTPRWCFHLTFDPKVKYLAKLALTNCFQDRSMIPESMWSTIRWCVSYHHYICLIFDPNIWPCPLYLRSNTDKQMVKPVKVISYSHFTIGLWYLVYWCMSIRRCVGYHQNICLDFDPKVKYLAKLVRAITFLSLQIDHWYWELWCLTNRRWVTYHHDICLTFDPMVK